ncbi:MAG: CAP domain-containing protein [Bacteroidetes bacterium]|nr:CAP domain-containing protein [Bacteroidota bacterium]
MKILTAFGMLLLSSWVSPKITREARGQLKPLNTFSHAAHKTLRNSEQYLEAVQNRFTFLENYAPPQEKYLQQPESFNADTNSAAKTTWMSAHDREVLYWLNVARLNPSGFFNRFLLKAAQANPSNSYLSSLMKTMYSMKPVPALIPDKSLYDAAMCHARSSGISGYVGHTRNNTQCKKIYTGECCSYGADSPLDVVIQLLVDEGVTSLGHRILCLGEGFTIAGIASAPHTRFRTNTVIDFR